MTKRKATPESWLFRGTKHRAELWAKGQVSESRRLHLQRPRMPMAGGNGLSSAIISLALLGGAAIVAFGSFDGARRGVRTQLLKPQLKAVLRARQHYRSKGTPSSWARDRFNEYQQEWDKVAAALKALPFAGLVVKADEYWSSVLDQERKNLRDDKAHRESVNKDVSKVAVSGWNRMVKGSAHTWLRPGSDAQVEYVKDGWTMEGREP